MTDREITRPGATTVGANGGALHGVRILDLTSVIMGPYATQILGDLGADVITVEAAGGDTCRFMSPGPHPQLSGIALNLLRNKRNLSIDLKRPEGREAVLRLAASCDVFVTNLRPGSLARLGLSYEDVRAARPDVVYCQAQGFPSDSAEADAPAYDDIIQAASGVADASRRTGGVAMLTPTVLADKVSGLAIVYSILAALFHRERTGLGQHIEVPMVDVLSSFVLVEHGAGAIPRPPMQSAGYRRILTPNRRPQRTRDGWIAVLPYEKEHYDALFEAGGRPDLLGDERYATGSARVANSHFLYGEIHSIIATKSSKEWLELCESAGIPVTLVADLDDLVDELPAAEHPIGGAYKVIPPPVRFSGTPSAVRLPAPTMGQHNRELLREIGFSDDDVTALEEARVLRGHPRRR